jgi:hypothetical protein
MVGMVKDLMVKVFHDGYEVFEGALGDFLKEKDNDSYITEVCKDLKKYKVVEFSNARIGHWSIEKQ